MRVIALIKANADSESGTMPEGTEQMLAEMNKFNDELVKAGVMMAGEGLHPSSKGARILFDGDRRTVVDGPFAETKELIAGFWIWKVASLEEAIEWAKKCPNPSGAEGQIELRPIFELEEFGDVLTPELREEEERQRAEIARQHGA